MGDECFRLIYPFWVLSSELTGVFNGFFISLFERWPFHLNSLSPDLDSVVAIFVPSSFSSQLTEVSRTSLRLCVGIWVGVII